MNIDLPHWMRQRGHNEPPPVHEFIDGIDYVDGEPATSDGIPFADMLCWLVRNNVIDHVVIAGQQVPLALPPEQARPQQTTHPEPSLPAQAAKRPPASSYGPSPQ